MLDIIELMRNSFNVRTPTTGGQSRKRCFARTVRQEPRSVTSSKRSAKTAPRSKPDPICPNARFYARVDGFVPRMQNINLRMACQSGDTTPCRMARGLLMADVTVSSHSGHPTRGCIPRVKRLDLSNRAARATLDKRQTLGKDCTEVQEYLAHTNPPPP